MYNGNTVSLGSIIWKVMKRPMASDLTYEEAAEFALEFTRLMGAPLIYLDKITEPITLSMYKARVPDDMLFVKGVKYSYDSNMVDDGIAMTHATDIYHKGNQPYNLRSDKFKEVNSIDNSQGYTYVIEKSIIKTSIENGCITISYKGLALDENGFPLVPDDEKFKLGLEYYILHRYIEPLWEMGKIPDKVFNYIEQKRHWYYSSAHTSLQMPDIDQMEAVMNGINRIIVNNQAQENFFRGYGKKERIKKYH
jgi:hypothetical protein